MPYLTALITALSILLFLVLGVNVSRARGKYGVKAPAMTGHEAFERVNRVHQNTLEQLVMFVPSLWLFSAFAPTSAGEYIAGFLGFIWLVGRILYARAYYRDASKRSLGFVMGALSTVLLLFGGLIGILLQLFAVAGA